MRFWFKKKTPEGEAERGAKNASTFLASSPSPEEVQQYFSAACVDEAFDRSDTGQAYAKASKEVLRYYIESHQALAR